MMLGVTITDAINIFFHLKLPQFFVKTKKTKKRGCDMSLLKEIIDFMRRKAFSRALSRPRFKWKFTVTRTGTHSALFIK